MSPICPVSDAFIHRVLQTQLGQLLIPTLRAELEHESKDDLIRCNHHPDSIDICGELSHISCYSFVDSPSRRFMFGVFYVS